MPNDDEFDRDGSEVLDPNIRRQLREAEKQRGELEETRARLAALERKQAFDEAGIPTTGPGALFRKAHEGSMTPEALRDAAAEYGIETEGSAPRSTEPDLRAELEALRAAQSGGSVTHDQPSREDLFKQALDALDAIKDPKERERQFRNVIVQYSDLGFELRQGNMEGSFVPGIRRNS